MRYQFGEWLVEPDLNRISRSGESHALEPKTMDVLQELLSHAGETLSKDLLLDRLWDDRHGEHTMIEKRVSDLRKLFRDPAKKSAYIQTVRKKGYRAVATVEAKPESAEDPERDQSAIAVLPFSNLSDSEDWFVMGMHQEIMTSLTRIHDLTVIPRNSVMRFSDGTASTRAISESLGVAFIMEGSVQLRDEQARISVQLIDAEHDRQVWAESFHRGLSDVFGVQSEVAEAVADRLLKIMEPGRPTAPSPSAYALFLRGRELLDGDTDSVRRAVAILEEATASDTGFGLAYAYLARAYKGLEDRGVFTHEDAMACALPAAERALEADSNNPEVLYSLAVVHKDTRFSDGRMGEYLRQTLAKLPDHIGALGWQGELLRMSGDPAGATRNYRRMIRLDPLNWAANLQMANVLRRDGRLDEAESYIERSVMIRADWESRMHVAGFYANTRNGPKHAENLLAAHRADSGSLRPIFACAEFLSALGDSQAAELWMRRASSIAPNDRLVFQLKAQAAELKDLDSILASWKRFVGESAYSYPVQQARSALLHARQTASSSHRDRWMKKFDELIRSLFQDEYSDIAGAFQVLAARLLGHNHWQQMAEDLIVRLERSLELNHYQLLILHALTGDLSKATHHYTQMLYTDETISMEDLGIFEDPGSIFNGLATHKEFVEARKQKRKANRRLLTTLRRDLPDLFDATPPTEP